MKPFQISDENFKKIISETSNRIFHQQFGSRTAITGEDIIEFSPHAQVNRFILFQIYQEWTIQMSKLNSPYFDFKNPEVKQAFQGFQNYLSQFIRVEKKDFKTLVDKAVYNTLRLVLNPNEVFSNFFFLNQENIALSHIERYAPYFSDFDFVISSIISYHKKHGLDRVEKKVFFEKVIRVVELYEQRVGHSIDNYRAIIFHKLTQLEISQLQTTVPKPEEIPQNNEFEGLLAKFQQLNQEVNYPINEMIEQNNTSQETIHKQQTPTNQADTNLISNTSQPKLPLHHEKQDTPSRLADRFTDQSQPNNKFLHQIDKKTQEILLDHIPMHKQFQYISKVFAGNRNKMVDTINAINQLSTMDEAENYLNTRIYNMPEVDRNDPIVVEFLQMVKNSKL